MKKQFLEERVDLVFFRRGSKEPDELVVTKSEAQDAINSYYLWLSGNYQVSKPWMDSENSFVINFSDVEAIRYGKLGDLIPEEDDNEEDEDDYDNLDPLKHGFGPED